MDNFKIESGCRINVDPFVYTVAGTIPPSFPEKAALLAHKPIPPANESRIAELKGARDEKRLTIKEVFERPNCSEIFL